MIATPGSRHDLRDETILDTIAFMFLNDLLILYYSEKNPTDPEWDAWIACVKQRAHSAMLIWSDGGAPNPSQRARLVDGTDAGPAPRPPLALLTDSALVRGMMTAFAWLRGRHQPMKAFPQRELDQALAWLGVSFPSGRVQAELMRLSVTLSAKKTERAKVSR
jgi:hypothetical protein